MSHRPFAFFLFTASLLGQEVAPDTVFPADTPAQIGDTTWQACRVVNAVTGAPIAGAELVLIHEDETPLPRQFWSRRQATSDADGFVRVRSDDIEGGFRMLLLRAPGYGAAAANGTAPSLVWALSPGIDVPVEARDWQGMPVGDTELGLCLGGGDTPDVATTKTDAQGRAVFRGIDPGQPTAEIYPLGPTYALTEHGLLDWVPGSPPVVVPIARGHHLSGKVIDHNGNPMAEAHVGALQVARGPWSITDEDGSFAIEGAFLDADLTVRVGRQIIQFERPDGESPFVLQLPELSAEALASDTLPDDPGEIAPDARGRRKRKDPPPILVQREPLPETGLCPVELKVASSSGDSIEFMEIELRGPLPRYRLVTEDVRDGKASFERLPGKYTVRSKDADYEAEIGTIEVTADKPARFDLTARRLAPLRVQALKKAELGTISLRTAAGTRDITDRFDADGNATIGVPNRDPFCFVIGNDVGVLVVRTTLAEAAAKPPFVLRGATPTRVTGTLVGADGKPLAADITLLSRDACLHVEEGLDVRTLDLTAAEAGALRLATTHEGLAFVVAVPRAKNLRPAIVPVTLPPLGAEIEHAFGEIRIAAAPAVVIRTADGKPCTDAIAEVIRVGWHDVRKAGPRFVLDSTGALLSPTLTAGDAIVVAPGPWDSEAIEGDDPTSRLPFRTVLAGAGPWTIDLPAGEVNVALRDAAGAPANGRIFIGDRCIGVNGKLRLQQVPKGKHDVVAVGINKKSVRSTVEVGDKPTVLEITLPDL
jgi:hypothetical protein